MTIRAALVLLIWLAAQAAVATVPSSEPMTPTEPIPATFEKLRISNADGSLQSVWLLRNGKVVHKRTYYPDGVTASHGPMRDGHPHGEWLFFDESGRVLRTVRYDDGQPVDRAVGSQRP